MCGIAGIFDYRNGSPVNPEQLRAMTRVLAHRGPDGDGHWISGAVGLGHRRLAIIDLVSGAQPMSGRDGRLSLVFNGEIYNYAEFVEPLRQRGYRFQTTSDTEVILHSWQERGADCLAGFRGMFAMALWDSASRSLTLVRDRLGVKPLYYADLGGTLIFGSEIKALLAHPALSRAIDPGALATYLALGFQPGDRSMLSAVRQVPPGSLLSVTAGGEPKLVRWWDFSGPDARESATSGSRPTPYQEAELLERLEAHLAETVRLRMVSDVPVGAFLSGGIDSSLIVALMARQSSEPVRTFSIGFDFASFDERPYARMVANHVGARHEEFVVNADLTELLPRLVWHYDDPFADPSMIPTFRVAEIAARHVTVALSGDGGDESFGGYQRYVNALANNRADHLPGAVRGLFGAMARALPDMARGKNRLRWLSLSGDERYADFFASTPPWLVQRHLSAAMKSELAAGGLDAEAARRRAQLPDMTACPYQDPLARMQYFDSKLYLPGDILMKVDRAAMASSLESREPLLDHRVMEFGLSLPERLRIDGRQTKVLLARLARKLVPVEAIDRPKQGFSVPLDQWFRGELAPMVRGILLDDTTRTRGWLDPAGVERTLREHQDGKARHGTTLWGLLMLELWARRFLDGPLDPPPAPAPRAEFLAALRGRAAGNA